MLDLPEGGARQDPGEPGFPARAAFPLSTHLAAKAWLLFAHGPVSAMPLFSSVGHDREVYLPASSLGPPGLEPRGSQHWGRVWWPQGGGREPRPCAGRRQEGGRLHPAALHFYELQREAKFPQPPNETESKSELIGNRQEGGELEEELRPVQG